MRDELEPDPKPHRLDRDLLHKASPIGGSRTLGGSTLLRPGYGWWWVCPDSIIEPTQHNGIPPGIKDEILPIPR